MESRWRDLGRLTTASRELTTVSARAVRRRRRGDPWTEAVAEELRHGFERLGPTYTKLGQMVASSPALFPRWLVEGMQGCLDRVRPLPVATVLGVVEAELGAPPSELFARFDPVPLASASIGQVHAATTADGHEVVVKVQRPDIVPLIHADIRLLADVAALAERWSRHARLVQPRATVEDFSATLAEELSFMVEARAMEAVASALADFVHADRLRVPEVHWRWTTPRVLTMERVRGVRLDDVDALRAQGVDPAETLRTTVRGWLHGILVHGVFHGDLHAGNLLVDPDGRVVFLDFGICGRLTEEARHSLFVALPAIVARDFDAVCDAVFSPLEEEHVVDRAAVARDLATSLTPVLDAPIGEVSYAQAFVEVVRVGLRHGVLLPRDLLLVFKQFFYVERYTRLLAPGWQPLTDDELLADIAAVTG